jgi:thiamine biosynthesis protein ThiS
MAILTVNGDQRQFPDDGFPATIADLLGRLGVNAATVVAELEGEIIERERFAATRLSAGQSIELVKFVPGG